MTSRHIIAGDAWGRPATGQAAAPAPLVPAAPKPLPTLVWQHAGDLAREPVALGVSAVSSVGTVAIVKLLGGSWWLAAGLGVATFPLTILAWALADELKWQANPPPSSTAPAAPASTPGGTTTP